MAGSGKAVYAALGANSVVTLAKVGGFLASGSPAMLSEAIHSFADVMNQSLLALGLRTSAGKRSEDYPYGMHRDRFVWALISAVGVLFLGCGVTVYHGVSSLFHPAETSGSLWMTLGVLGFAFVVEGATLLVAVKEVRGQAAGRPLLQFFREMDDPLAAAVLLEDAAAVTGVVFASIGIALSHVTGRPVFDSVASILIGLMLGVVAILLVRRNRQLLLGAAPAGGVTDRIEELLEADPAVEDVHDIRVVVLGSGAIKVAADVDFDARHLSKKMLGGMDLPAAWEKLDGPETLGQVLEEFGVRLVDSMADEVDRLEATVREVVPTATHVDLEAD
jgi:zinc transporter 9